LHLTALSILIGSVVFLGFLYVELIRSSVPIPRLRQHGYDLFAAFLLIADLIRYYLFLVRRTDALAILNGDLSIGNISAVVWTTTAAFYLAFVLLTGRFRVEWLFRRPYFSIAILLSVYLCTTAWSIAPTFTFYRGYELVVWVCLSIYFFTRLESLDRKILFLGLYCTTWFLLNFPDFIESLSRGIVFSAIKDNFLPAVGFSVAVLGWTTRLRVWSGIVGLLTFVLAGSAAAVASAMAACFVGLAFNRSMALKFVGYIGLLAATCFMVVFLVAPDQFPEAVDLLSSVLQKPKAELLDATGRYAIWSTLWDVTKDNYFGSGFGSDRFIQLLGGADVSDRLGSPNVFVASAHNAALSAWTAAGWLGVVALLFVFIDGIRYSAQCRGSERVTTTMCLVFIVLNSLTIPGLGGFYSCVWLVWIAVLSVGQREPRRFRTGFLQFAKPRLHPINFHVGKTEPESQISRTRVPDKTSGLHPRHGHAG
jgi:exopolysaccharide production protein ExoQ